MNPTHSAPGAMIRRTMTPSRTICVALLVAAFAACSDEPQLTDPAQRALRPFTATAAAVANGKIAFERNNEIHLINPDGSGLTRLTNGGASQPAWSLDGTKLAFVSGRDGNREIYVMNADGTGLTRLTNDPAADLRPTWSPDGTMLAFSSDRDGNGEIYVMNADGSGQTNLTSHSALDNEPAWSPDGTKIAFTSHRDDHSEIYVMNADGTAPTRLTNAPGLNDVPAWSPDGSRIVFHSSRVTGASHLWVMNADGSEPTRLTNTPAALNIFPAWSPDGTKIAFARLHNSTFNIYVVNADGSEETQVTSDPTFDMWPAWQSIPADSDADGVPNTDDLCPNTPTGASVDASGCIPQQRIEQLDAQVDALLSDGTLTSDQAAGLNDKLTAALASIDVGRTTPACWQLRAFIGQVSGLMRTGSLSPQTGGELLEAASALRAQIGC
jgi:hypothetical protein